MVPLSEHRRPVLFAALQAAGVEPSTLAAR
jgi:hypothetical protein